MPNLPFSKIDDVENFSVLPNGTYNCYLDSVKEKFTNSGNEMWNLKFKVLDGDYEGSTIFDNLVFSEAAYPRAKLICSRLGLDTDNDVELTQDMIVGRKVRITVETGEYQDKNGDWKKKNTVTFAGYEKYEVKKKS